MIDSVLERSKKKIVIDRIMVNGNLVTDPDSVKNETVKHFQSCTGDLPSTSTVIPDEWQAQYLPQDHVQPTWYSALMDPISFEEWMNIVKESPNNKASGPSGITYELIKHLGTAMQNMLLHLINACIRLSVIPADWLDAFVYPIPKPTEWQHELKHTRPITLLEAPRKLMVKALNTRLSNLMSLHPILKGQQFAAKPGASTMEPIRIMNEIIDDAKENNKELWILFQDLSKCYDRVDINILRRAMCRIKLPESFTNLITSLFIKRTNCVFTEYGLTDRYPVLVGIDQGEVISPLLWCIYYDPLLSEIQNRNLGYKMDHSYLQNVYDPSSRVSRNLSIPALAYMDDTNWISDSKANLTSILNLAQSFFHLTHIRINHFKTDLMRRYPTINVRFSAASPAPVTFTLQDENVTITPIPYNGEGRYLGVWISLSKSKSF